MIADESVAVGKPPGVGASDLIGAPIGRLEGRAKVTGATRYAADVPMPGTLWGAVLRSPLPHARIVRVDTARARDLPGVHAVLAGADVPPILFGRMLSDIPVLCRDVVRFVGDRVAAVAAETRAQAEAALAAIEVEYEELPAVFTPAEALADGAPTLHPEFSSYHGATNPPGPPNVHAHERLGRGDVESGFARAEIVVEHTYRTPIQHQGYLEAHSCLVWWDERAGRVHVWASNKDPFLLRGELARVFSLQVEQVVVHNTPVGGDFGGKGSAMEMPLTALLSRASGRPVRIVLSGVEELTAAAPRHASEITVRTGLSRDGRILARAARAVFDGGAYAGYKPMPGVNLAARFWSVGPYRIPDTQIENRIVYTNHVPGGHMRAPGIFQVTHATEVDMDRLAEIVGIDPFRFRALNAVQEGDRGPLDEPWTSIRLVECLERATEAAGWDQPRPPGMGLGLAVSHCAGGFGTSTAIVEVDGAGRVTLRTGVADQGTGAHTVLAQIVATELQVPLDRVDVAIGDTDTAPWTLGASASRLTYVAGRAAQAAAADAGARLASLAAEYLGCPEQEVELLGGAFRERGRGTVGLRLDELAARALAPGQPVVGHGEFGDRNLSDTPSFAVLVAEVDVDRATGAIHVRRLVGAYDVGTVINRLGLVGQLEGGLIQGLGAALMEEVRCVDGRVETTSLAEYKLPTSMDVPEIETILITDAPGTGPFGAKSVGELTNPLVAPALANAVYDAVGVRVTDLPLSAEKVYDALQADATAR